MSRSFPTTLPTSRFSLVALGAALAAALSVGTSGVYAQASTVAADSAASAPAAPGLADDFAARQKVLDQRSAENDYRYAVAEHDCYSRFFVNHCLGVARDKMREERASIRQAQLALDDEQRAVRAKQRDEQIALKQAQNAAEAPQRAANKQAYDQKQADFQRKLDEAHAQAAQKAQARAENAARYEQKQKEAAQHKAEVEQRQREAAEKAKQQQQQGQ
ncbi:TPA: hypothetical protein QDB46_004756 [Burkholderia multivorans]|nr:hypothetical protein [Burkholderia multivorans]HDR9295094.1 hypothetical protein [Burkholderia multivorans]HDR9301525.1 hypothetical protein [Burkholderia multivorans]HDR9307601.1 hypothetical protein [Burkholderia multivorans]HDR9312680.1 hypothetical protein [Burkholderia multivorans]